MGQQQKSPITLFADFIEQYDLYTSFFRQKWLLYTLGISIVIICLPFFKGAWWYLLLRIIALLVLSFVLALISAGEYKVLLNFYDTGIMQEVSLKPYVKQLPRLLCASFFGHPFFASLLCLAVLAPFMVYGISYLHEHRELLKQTYIFYATVGALLIIMLAVALPFACLVSRFRFVLVNVVDKNEGLWSSMKKSWALTSAGFFALMRMQDNMDKQFIAAEGTRYVDKKIYVMVSKVILYRMLGSENK